MRVLMKAQLGPAMTAGPDSGPGPALGQMMERLQPEAAYFYPENGNRSALLVFDLHDPSEMPSIAEPFYRAGAISVDWAPAMTFEELQAGLARMGQAGAAA